MVGYIFNRVRTRRRAMEQLREIVAHRRRDGPLHIAILQARASDEAEELRQVLEIGFAPVELYVTQFTTVIGVHTGPGVLGIAFYWGD